MHFLARKCHCQWAFLIGLVQNFIKKGKKSLFLWEIENNESAQLWEKQISQLFFTNKHATTSRHGTTMGSPVTAELHVGHVELVLGILLKGQGGVQGNVVLAEHHEGNVHKITIAKSARSEEKPKNENHKLHSEKTNHCLLFKI